MLFSIHLGTKVTGLLIRPQPIMFIMLLSSAHKITHYAQYYAHHILILSQIIHSSLFLMTASA